MINKLLKFSLNNQYAKNIFFSARASILNQILSLLSFPILSLIYSPEDFGLFALYNSYLALLLSFSMLRIDWYIPNVTKKINTTILIYIGISANTLCGFAYIAYIAYSHKLSGNDIYHLILPLQLTLSNLQLIFEALYVQKNSLKIIYNIKLIQNLSNIFLCILLGYLFNIELGLIYGYFISFLVALILNIKYIRNTNLKPIKIKYIKIYNYFKHVRKILIANTISCIFNVFSFSSIPIILSFHYSINDIGVYSTMLRFANAPFMFITSSITSSFWSESSALSKNNPKMILPLYISTLKKLLILSLLLSAILLLSPHYIGYVFIGKKWEISSNILISLIPMLIGIITASPINHLWVINKSHFQILSDLLRIILVALSILMCSWLNISFINAILLVSISSLISHLSNIFINIYFNKKILNEN